MDQQKQDSEIVFGLEKIYLKDVSYEAPHVPQAFIEKTAPEVGIQLAIDHSLVHEPEGIFEVILTITVTAKLQEKAVFLTEAKQAGLFRIRGMKMEEIVKVLEITCPNILLPFAREAINDLVGKGGFPQLLINPINFEALYQQKHADSVSEPLTH